MTPVLRKLTVGLLWLTALAGQPAHAWWNDQWTTRTRVDFDTTGPGLAAPQSDIVLPVRLHSGNFDFAAAQPDGQDLRVIAGDDKTPLPFEVERFDGVNELALLWVRLPALKVGSAVNVVYVYAGNAKAPTEGRSAVFADGHAAVFHFSEPDGPGVDAAGGARTATPPLREINGLLAGSARMDGAAISVPASDRLKIATGGALTVSMWVKPDAMPPGQATLLALGPLSIGLDSGKLTADIDGKSTSGGDLPPSAWAHVALAASGTKATLYVNGKPAATLDAAVPAIDAPLVLGRGYKGLIDELQISTVPRDEGWVRQTVAAQGGDGSFGTSTKESADEAGTEGMQTGYIGVLVKHLTVDAWVVIVILGGMFVIAAWVMTTKLLMVVRMAKANDRFIKRFRNLSAEDGELKGRYGDSPLYRLYRNGMGELDKRLSAGALELSGASFNAIKASLDADLVRETHRLNDRMVLLTIAISGGPFLGLLGTVVGVMITFAAIAAAGDVNVNAIAPGIAAALLATVAGLGVAIPSLFGYNYLAAKIKNLSSDMQIFVDEFVTRAAEAHGQR
jgi:biopolymer transport protein ExbB